MAHHEDLADVTTGEWLENVHPGEILMTDFIEALGLTKNAVAKAIGVGPSRIGEIVRGERSITADTDLRLSRFFGTSEGYWLALQNAYDLEQARRVGRYDDIPSHAA
ncbi:addiction module antidote protein, HigA family [Pseudomonas sp. PIC25]|uniref:HigA family addiction module antitoxin n=1 Tax=Pseudomonas sp. PIC25 TaxID=1958773 RepID=UPI000BABF4DC|nr:HigA family addiction module antitoxin [Pseudomonas sp. PIC25]PAU61430.1 addiction module antidote protein, HigA family [Pseudomonas sp. PIC25]